MYCACAHILQRLLQKLDLNGWTSDGHDVMPPESRDVILDQARQRIHHLLDDAFALVASRSPRCDLHTSCTGSLLLSLTITKITLHPSCLLRFLLNHTFYFLSSPSCDVWMICRLDCVLCDLHIVRLTYVYVGHTRTLNNVVVLIVL